LPEENHGTGERRNLKAVEETRDVETGGEKCEAKNTVEIQGQKGKNKQSRKAREKEGGSENRVVDDAKKTPARRTKEKNE